MNSRKKYIIVISIALSLLLGWYLLVKESDSSKLVKLVKDVLDEKYHNEVLEFIFAGNFILYLKF